MTPYEIELMLHFYCSQAAFPRYCAPIYHETMMGLLDRGLVKTFDTEGNATLTDKGRAYIKLLCSMPIPVQGWSIPSWTPPTYMEGSW